MADSTVPTTSTRKPINVAIRIFPGADGFIALLNDFESGGVRWTSDDPAQLIDDIHEWMDNLVEK